VIGKILAQFGLCDLDSLISAFVDVSAKRRSEFHVAECQVVTILTNQNARSPCSHGWSPLLNGSCWRDAIISWLRRAVCLGSVAPFVGSVSADDAILAGTCYGW
jgi:hypothetical protein